MSALFQHFAARVARAAGHPLAFVLALALILAWAISGPFLGFSEVWQLTVNTATTIVTFLLVFVIQATQNADTRALHAKLDELIMATDGARNALAGIEHTDELEGE